jgi:hypothetical protein
MQIACDTPYSGDFRGTAEVRVWADALSRNTDVVREALRELDRRRAAEGGGAGFGYGAVRPVLSTSVGRMTFYNPELPPQVGRGEEGGKGCFHRVWDLLRPGQAATAA